MTHTLTFTPSGEATTIGTDAIPLQTLGHLTVSRASTIEFNSTLQVWQVHIPPENPHPLYSHPSRTRCLAWEHSYFESHPSH